MGLIWRIKRFFGFGKSQQQILQDAVDAVNDAYPDTPGGHFRCHECEEVFSLKYIGNNAFKKDEDGEVEVVYLCHECAQWDRVGGEAPPKY